MQVYLEVASQIGGAGQSACCLSSLNGSVSHMTHTGGGGFCYSGLDSLGGGKPKHRKQKRGKKRKSEQNNCQGQSLCIKIQKQFKWLGQSKKGKTVTHTWNKQLPAWLLFQLQLKWPQKLLWAFLRFGDSHLPTICPSAAWQLIELKSVLQRMCWHRTSLPWPNPYWYPQRWSNKTDRRSATATLPGQRAQEAP